MIKSKNKPFSQEMSMCNFSAIFSVTPISKTGFEVFIAHCCPPVEELTWLTGTLELSLNSFSRKNLQACSSSKRQQGHWRWVEMMGNLNLHNNADGIIPLSVHFRSYCVFLLKRSHVFDICFLNHMQTLSRMQNLRKLILRLTDYSICKTKSLANLSVSVINMAWK